MGKAEIESVLSHLATHGRVSASTQRQALNVMVFLYRNVLDKPIDGQIEPVKVKRHCSPPTVMTQMEVQQVHAQMHGTRPRWVPSTT